MFSVLIYYVCGSISQFESRRIWGFNISKLKTFAFGSGWDSNVGHLNCFCIFNVHNSRQYFLLDCSANSLRFCHPPVRTTATGKAIPTILFVDFSSMDNLFTFGAKPNNSAEIFMQGQ